MWPGGLWRTLMGKPRVPLPFLGNICKEPLPQLSGFGGRLSPADTHPEGRDYSSLMSPLSAPGLDQPQC